MRRVIELEPEIGLEVTFDPELPGFSTGRLTVRGEDRTLWSFADVHHHECKIDGDPLVIRIAEHDRTVSASFRGRLRIARPSSGLPVAVGLVGAVLLAAGAMAEGPAAQWLHLAGYGVLLSGIAIRVFRAA